MMNKCEPRYAAYCRALGRDPEASGQEEREVKHYAAWITAMWRQFDALTGRTSLVLTPEDQEAFDRWLSRAAHNMARAAH